MRSLLLTTIALAAVMALGACEDGTNVSDTAIVRVLLTDAPSDIIVSPGAKATLYFIAMAAFQAGDRFGPG